MATLPVQLEHPAVIYLMVLSAVNLMVLPKVGA